MTDFFGQRLDLDQLEDEREHAARVVGAVDRGDVRMIERGQQFGFPLKTGDPASVAGEHLRQDLDGDFAAKLRVARAIDFAHAAGADGVDDFVTADPCAGCQHGASDAPELYASQCLKCRRPVNTIASPCSSAAAITSASRTDPPGWTTAVAPARATASRPSRNGKNASEAATDAVSDFDAACAFMIATFTASTRLICPAPIARVRAASVKITVFDLTCAMTRQAKRMACHSSAVGWRFVTTLMPSTGHGSCASVTRSRSCTSIAQRTYRY